MLCDRNIKKIVDTSLSIVMMIFFPDRSRLPFPCVKCGIVSTLSEVFLNSLAAFSPTVSPVLVSDHFWEILEEVF